MGDGMGLIEMAIAARACEMASPVLTASYD